MGMYNELNKINQSINQQAVEIKKTQEHQKKVEYVKNELDGILLASLMTKNNIFDDDIKSIAIDEVINSTDVLLYNKDYTRQYVNKRYYTIARQVEQVKKKQSDNDDYKKRIAIKKLELQREKIQQKMQQEKKQKIARSEAIALNATISIIVAIIKGFATIVGSIILVLVSIAAGFFGGMCKGK